MLHAPPQLPLSSANADLARLAAHKRRLVLLNKTDLADPYRTQVRHVRWSTLANCTCMCITGADSEDVHLCCCALHRPSPAAERHTA